MIRLGNLFEIPLSGGRFAYGQYAFRDRKMGPIIQVFDVITENRMQVERLETNTLLFPPIITGLFAAVRAGMWRVIGKKAVENFIYPNFVSAYFDEKTGKARAWFLWDGEKNTPLGAQLPSEYKKLEYLMVWNPPYVVRRIETGEYVFPFRDLILYNKFTPRVRK